MASVTLSRGCGMRCAFCAIHRAGPYLRRPLPHIESELASLAASGVCIVNFEDDHLFSDHASTEPLLEMLGAFHTRGMGFMAMNGITAPRLAPHIDAALDAGFRECNLSLVSADPKVAAQIERPVFLPAIRKIAEHSLGRAAVVVFIILGLPGQSPKTALEDLLTLAALPVTLGVSPLYLLPGIPLFEDMGLPAASRLMRGSALYRFSPGFSREDVVALWKLTRMLGAIKRSAASPEHLHYFGRSLATGSWHRLHEEKWLTFIDNPLVLPDCVAVTTTEGAKLSWYPLRGECR